MESVRELIDAVKYRITPKAAEDLKRLAERPEVKAIFDDFDKKAVEARAVLVEQIRTAPDRHAKRQTATTKAYAAATAKREEARRELGAALDRERDALAEKIAADFNAEQEVAAAQRELQMTADPRLQEAIFDLDQLAAELRGKFVTWPIVDPESRKSWVASNVAELDKATAAVAIARAVCVDMQLQALSSLEIETRLQRAFDDMAPSVGVITPRLQIPQIVDGQLLRAYEPGRLVG